MRHVVELCYDVMPMLWSGKTVFVVNLWAKVAQDEDGGLIWTVQQGTNKQFEVFHAVLITLVVRIELQYHKIGMLWDMMSTAEAKVAGVCPPHGSIGELGRGVREYV